MLPYGKCAGKSAADPLRETVRTEQGNNAELKEKMSGNAISPNLPGATAAISNSTRIMEMQDAVMITNAPKGASAASEAVRRE